MTYCHTFLISGEGYQDTERIMTESKVIPPHSSHMNRMKEKGACVEYINTRLVCKPSEDDYFGCTDLIPSGVFEGGIELG